MNAIPQLHTDRLLLRGWLSDDVNAWARICSDEETMRFIGDGSPMPPDRAWHALAYLLGHWALRGYGQWAVVDRHTNLVVGRAGLYHPQDWPGVELGWLIDRSRWGQGLATEASRAAAEWAFTALGADSLISLIRPANVASSRVAEKLGAVLTDRIMADGHEAGVYVLHATALQRNA